jgi:hypothetical protein
MTREARSRPGRWCDEHYAWERDDYWHVPILVHPYAHLDDHRCGRGWTPLLEALALATFVGLTVYLAFRP